MNTCDATVLHSLFADLRVNIILSFIFGDFKHIKVYFDATLSVRTQPEPYTCIHKTNPQS